MKTQFLGRRLVRHQRRYFYLRSGEDQSGRCPVTHQFQTLLRSFFHGRLVLTVTVPAPLGLRRPWSESFPAPVGYSTAVCESSPGPEGRKDVSHEGSHPTSGEPGLGTTPRHQVHQDSEIHEKSDGTVDAATTTSWPPICRPSLVVVPHTHTHSSKRIVTRATSS